MTWNYRLCKRTHVVPEPIRSRLLAKNPDMQLDEVLYEIMEIYYDEDGHPGSYRDGPATVLGNDPEEAKRCFELMKGAFEKAVLDLDGFKITTIDKK